MQAVNETFISPTVYAEKTTAIQGNGTSLKLDNSTLDSAEDICTTDVMTLLVEIENQAYDLTVQHNTHFSQDLPAFLNLIAQSMVETDTTLAGSLESADAVTV